MQNIQIKKPKNRRNIESLIEDSALDNQFNYEAHQLKKAFNQTLTAMNTKNRQLQSEIEKMKIIIRQYQQGSHRYQSKIIKLEEELYHKNNQLSDMSNQFRQNQKKLQYLQYKFQSINENKNSIQQDQSFDYPTQRENLKKNKIRNQIYHHFNQMILAKIDYFTLDMKKISLSKQAEQRIQAFLEELVYINPHSEFQIQKQIKQQRRNYLQGKILNEGNSKEQDSWKMLQKSLQKLKVINVKQRGPLPIDNEREDEKVRQRSVSVKKRRRVFY